MKYPALIVFIFCFSAYLINLSPTITSDDSGELAGVASTLGTAHSPGYPLYSLFGKIINTLLPFSNHAYRANLLSALSAASGIAIFYLFILVLTSKPLLSFLISLVCGFSFFIYEMSTVTEVYGITILISTTILYVCYMNLESTKKFYLISFLAGLGLASHYIIGMWLPALVYIYLRENRFSARKLFYLALCGAGGLSIFFYLFVRANMDPLYNWEDPSTIKRFLQVVARTRYGAINLTQGEMNFLDFSLWADKVGFFFKSIRNGFSWPGFLAGFCGIIISFFSKNGKTRDNITVPFLALLFFGSGPFFLILANVKIDEASEALLLRFFYLIAIIWSTYIALALSRFKKTGVLIAAIILLAVMMKNISFSNRRHFTFYDYAKNLLKNAPPNSLVFFDRADEMEFCVSYLLRVEKMRGDLKFIDCNAGVSKSIYGDDYYLIWGAPRLALRNSVESEIVNRSERPVLYATFLPTQTSIPKKPYGLLYAAKFDPKAEFSDEIFALRKPQNEIRSKSLYWSHFQLLGDYYLSSGDAEKAKKMFDTVFYGAKTPFSYYKLGHYYYVKGERGKAKFLYEKIMDFYPESSDVYVNLGVIHEKEGNFAKSESLYRKAIEIDGKNSKAYYNLGVIYWKKSDWKNAVKYFKEALLHEPENQDIRRLIDSAQQRL